MLYNAASITNTIIPTNATTSYITTNIIISTNTTNSTITNISTTTPLLLHLLFLLLLQLLLHYKHWIPEAGIIVLWAKIMKA